LKTFYEGWTTELTAFVELAEPVYEAWACIVSSQWHKTKALTRRQPNRKKISDLLFFFPLSFFFHVLPYFCHSFIFVFFYFNIKDNVVFKVWGYWENFGFLCCFYFFWKSLSFIFWTPIGLWEYEYYLWELVGIDKNINQMNECACKFFCLISLGIDFKNISCWLYSVILM
jgi:hypothetical protein